MNDWITATVSQLQREGVLLVEDGNHGEYRPRTDEFTDHGVAFIRAADIDQGGIAFASASRINEQARRRITKGIGQPGDILLSHKGTVGKLAIAPEDSPLFVCSPQTTFWRTLDGTRLNRNYLYVFMRSTMFRAQLAARAAETDMAPYVSLTSQRGLTVSLPPIAVQKAIANTIVPFDHKIELNRRMNNTLEAMARAIFKDWFVDFGPSRAKLERSVPYLTPEIWKLFPDSLDDERKPEGWAYRRAGDLFDIAIGRTPPRQERHHFVDSGKGLPWLSIKTMGGIQTFVFSSEEDLTPEAVHQFRVPLIRAGTVVVSFKLTVGRVAIVACDIYSNEAIAQLRPKPQTRIGSEYAYCYMKSFDYSSLGSTSSIATAVNSESIRGIRFLEPNPRCSEAFSACVRPLFDRIKINGYESRTLASVRDLLLLKLMSGEIRIKDAEKIAERAL
jgi:type I restriction enzyme, S subunit